MSNSFPLHELYLLDSSVHGILQTGILEWVSMLSSRWSSPSRDQTWGLLHLLPCGQILYLWATGEAYSKTPGTFYSYFFFFIQVSLIGCNMVKISLQGQTCWNLSFLFIFYYYYYYFCHTVQHSTVSLFPKQGSNPHPLEWKHRVLSTGVPGKSSSFVIII